MPDDPTCAACHGPLETVCSVFWGDDLIDLCEACMRIGSEKIGNDVTLDELLKSRADPDAPVVDIEGRVLAWLKRKQAQKE